MTEQNFTDHELKQIHKFIDSGIMHEASGNPIFEISELTEEQLEKIEVPENIEVPYHPICRCEIETITIGKHIEPGNWVAVNQNGEAIKGDAPNKLKK